MSLKISYELYPASYIAKALVKLAKKVPDLPEFDRQTEYLDFLEELNKELNEAFKAGRSFERSYKPEED